MLSLLSCLATAVGAFGLLHGMDASLTRSCEGGHRECVVPITLKPTKVDGDLQLTPLVHQPAVLCLELGVDVG